MIIYGSHNKKINMKLKLFTVVVVVVTDIEEEVNSFILVLGAAMVASEFKVILLSGVDSIF
jgi:hypothetical protein